LQAIRTGSDPKRKKKKSERSSSWGKDPVTEKNGKEAKADEHAGKDNEQRITERKDIKRKRAGGKFSP